MVKVLRMFGSMLMDCISVFFIWLWVVFVLGCGLWISNGMFIVDLRRNFFLFRLWLLRKLLWLLVKMIRVLF